ncbi:MAG: hypothetical protein H9872_02365 [Candidatus Cellulosilyticum pullistercoris]|uniref:Flagellar assembly protein FliH/Type III secretion system HrpE domain-containing protein n=1 Tax=Candidatus Cellulosilyticum pullistercoris TaxID=2838521 RepID=A0A9E2KAP2_9FIRM|nr:hypothetical protein [Candidatus Cellulosilyticum pullistercoris]
MSNIIKSSRIRNRSVLDLSDRMVTQVESICKKVEIETDLEAISQKESELKALEALLQEKVVEADNKVEEMISEATKKAQNIEKDARDRETKVIADAYYKQEEIISQAEKEADAIKKAALDEKQSILETIESEVVEVIITLLQHIISEEVTGHVEWLKMVVRRLLLQEEVSEEVTLLVSSNTMALLQEDKDQLVDRLSKLTAIEVDEMLNDTTCVLVTNQGNIEYDINEGLRKVVSELRILKDLT